MWEGEEAAWKTDREKKERVKIVHGRRTFLETCCHLSLSLKDNTAVANWLLGNRTLYGSWPAACNDNMDRRLYKGQMFFFPLHTVKWLYQRTVGLMSYSLISFLTSPSAKVKVRCVHIQPHTQTAKSAHLYIRFAGKRVNEFSKQDIKEVSCTTSLF